MKKQKEKTGIRFDLLEKLALFLIEKNIPDFDFSSPYQFDLIAQCVKIWPDHWEFTVIPEYENLAPFVAILKDKDIPESKFPYTSARYFFGLTEKQSDHLFNNTLSDSGFPSQNTVKFGGMVLYSDSLKEAVASNIFDFIRVMKNETKKR